MCSGIAWCAGVEMYYNYEDSGIVVGYKFHVDVISLYKAGVCGLYCCRSMWVIIHVDAPVQ